jgi:hypothetical protein
VDVLRGHLLQLDSSGGGGEGASLAAVLAAARQSEKMEVRRGSPSKDEMRDVAAEKKTSVSVRLVRKCFLVLPVCVVDGVEWFFPADSDTTP